MKNRILAIIGLFFGLFSLVLSIFSDSMKREQIDLGPVQILLLLVSLLVICVAITALHYSKNPFDLVFCLLKKCVSGLEKFFLWAQAQTYKLLSNNRNLKIQNIFFISLFGCFSVLYTLGRWNGNNPYIFLNGDASTIASFSAALDHPSNFINDFMLFPLSKVTSYISIQVPIIRFLGKVFNGYGYAFLFILPITIFSKLFGFYHLGKYLLKKPFYGFLLAICTFPVIYTGVWDYWGLVADALPRNLFEIFFPWLILWSIKWINEPKKWILFSLFLGGLSYVHSISAPIIFLSIWTALFISSKISFKEKISRFLPSLFLYGFLLIPFVIGYFRPTTSNPKLSYEEGRAILQFVFGNHLNLKGIVENLYYQLLRSGLLVPFVITTVVLIVSWKKRRSSQAMIITGWIIGLLLFTIGLTFIESQIENYLHILPLQMFFIRAIRYLPPLVVIMIFLAFLHIGQLTVHVSYPAITRFSIKAIFSLILLSVLTYTINHNPQGGYFVKEIRCLQTGRITCQTSEEKDAIDIVKATQEISNVGDIILTVPPFEVSFERSIRYEMLRPLGYNALDINRVQDPYEIKKLIDILGPWRVLEKLPEEDNLSSYLNLAPSLKVDYLIIQKKDFPNDQLEKLDFIFSNPSYVLVKIDH